MAPSWTEPSAVAGLGGTCDAQQGTPHASHPPRRVSVIKCATAALCVHVHVRLLVAPVPQRANEELLAGDREHDKKEADEERDVDEARHGDEKALDHLLQALEVLDALDDLQYADRPDARHVLVRGADDGP